MKIYITFENIQQSDYTIIHPSQLDTINEICDTNECTELIVDNILQHVRFDQTPKLINMLINKLRHNGKIIITFMDKIEVMKKFLNGELNLIQLNEAIYGNTQQSSIISIPTVCEVLENRKLKILSKSLNTYTATIVAQRM